MNTSLHWKQVITEEITEDVAEQFSLFRQHFTVDDNRDVRTSNPEYYIWKLRDNPYGKGHLAIAYHNDRLIGTYSCTWRKACYHGNWYNVAKLGDAFTLSDYQGKGINTALGKSNINRAISRGADIVYNTPNELSRKSSVKMDMADHPYLNYYFWLLLLRPSAMFKSSAAGILTKPFNPLMAGLVRIAGRKRNSGISVSEADGFSEDFDDLHSQLGNRFAFHFDKSSRYLTYRYTQNPDQHKYRVITSRSNGLNGVLICKYTIQWGIKVLSAVDWYGRDPDAMHEVWCRFICLAREENYDMLAIWVPRNRFFRKAMKPFMAFPYKLKSFSVYQNETGLNLLKDKGNILFTATEADFI